MTRLRNKENFLRLPCQGRLTQRSLLARTHNKALLCETDAKEQSTLRQKVCRTPTSGFLPLKSQCSENTCLSETLESNLDVQQHQWVEYGRTVTIMGRMWSYRNDNRSDLVARERQWFEYNRTGTTIKGLVPRSSCSLKGIPIVGWVPRLLIWQDFQSKEGNKNEVYQDSGPRTKIKMRC